ncbi:hypothetical protein ACVGOW_00945 [Pseudonocardia saturnea]|jgi:hypothetical protein|nr:hypothetical protein [Pseudonocardia sp.]
MNRPRTPAAVAKPRPVLICESCRYAWEPAVPSWTAEHVQALSNGCPECGGWLYLGEIAPTNPTPTPRSART